jgi:hypothetical protein
MSKTKYNYGWADPRMPKFDRYRYEMRYGFMSPGYEVVKRNLTNNKVEEVVANGLTHTAAEGYIKILKEN